MDVASPVLIILPLLFLDDEAILRFALVCSPAELIICNPIILQLLIDRLIPFHTSIGHQAMATSELINDQQCSTTTNIQQQAIKTTMTEQTTEPIKPEESESCANLFSSIDFVKFLSKEFSSGPSSPFLSKDNSLPSFEVPSIFKSKDTFSQLFSSADWQMKFTQLEPKQETSSSVVAPKKNIPACVVAPAASAAAENTKESLQCVLSSRDWMASNTLGPHVDVSINRDMVLNAPSSEASLSPRTVNSDLSTSLPPARTDWDNMFFSQMQLMPPQIAPSPAPSLDIEEPAALPMEMPSSSDFFDLPNLDEDDQGSEEESNSLEAASAAGNSRTSDSGTGRKKRKRKPRKKVVPEVKKYVTPSQNDVLLGRGGRSNHHPGNKRYREEVKNLRTWYNSIGENKDEKTTLSQCLVDYVHSYKGRFLEKDKNGWYEVLNIVARRKASQALREDDDPEKRAAKRARFLEKKAAERGELPA